jgi:hypothetical protein
VLGPLLDGTDQSLSCPFAEMLDSVPSVEAVLEKIGGLLKAGVDGIKIYFSMPPDTARAVIKYVDKRVPVTAHLGYTHSLDAIHGGIDGLEHVLISPYNEFCSVNQQFGSEASMLDPAFFPRLIKGWEEADLKADGGAKLDRGDDRQAGKHGYDPRSAVAGQVRERCGATRS